MHNNVAPGSSGYTKKFYKAFWPVLKQRIMNAIHRTKEVDYLTSTKKIVIIQIIPKADKNLKLFTNWCPLSFLPSC